MAIAFAFRLPLVTGVGTVGYRQYDSAGTVLNSGTRVTTGITEIPSGSGQYWAYNDSPHDDAAFVVADDAGGDYSVPIKLNAVSREEMADEGFSATFQLPTVTAVGTVGYRQYDVNGSVLSGGTRITSGITEVVSGSGFYAAINSAPVTGAWFIVADDASGNYAEIAKVVQPTAFRGQSSLSGPEKFFIDNQFGEGYYVLFRNASFETYCADSDDFITYTTDTSSFAIAMTQINSTGVWEADIPGNAGSRTWSIMRMTTGGGTLPDDADASIDVKVADGFGYWNGESMEIGVTAQITGMTLLRGSKLTVVDNGGITGQTSLKAAIIDSRQQVYNTSTASINTSLDDIPWTLALMSLTEKSGEAGVGTAIYETDMPTIPLGPYTVLVQIGTNPVAQRVLAEQFFWDGQQVIPLNGILLDAFSFLRAKSPVGGGDTPKKLTITASNGGPVPQAVVRVTTDVDGMNVVSGDLLTDDLGQVTFLLNSGSYYAWGFRANTNIVNPKAFTVP